MLNEEYKYNGVKGWAVWKSKVERYFMSKCPAKLELLHWAKRYEGEKIDELPLDADMADLLAGLGADAPVGYWHDTGHADIKEGMGLLNHREHLERLAPRLLGFHLHDVSANGHDHQPVGAGHIDFQMISSFWRPEHRLTLELSPRATVDEVIASKARIEALLA